MNRTTSASEAEGGTAVAASVAFDIPGQSAPTTLAPHLLPFVDGQWAIWRQSCLRGAGFPAAQVLKLALPDCAAAADQIVDAENELHQAVAVAREALEHDLDQLRRDGLWEDKKKRRQLLNAAIACKAGKEPETGNYSPSTMAALSRAREKRNTLNSLICSFDYVFARGSAKLSNAIYEVARSERFQEAIVWQNHYAWQHAVRWLLRNPPDGTVYERSRKRALHEELVASYLQRYCVKNDTIGFFGPVGWANFAPETESIVQRPGKNLISARNVYFEGWGIDCLAAALEKNQMLRPWVAPRPMPFIRAEQEMLVFPSALSARPPVKLTPAQEVVFHACDGQRPAKLLADTVLSGHLAGLETEEDVYKVLSEFCSWGVITWNLGVPMQLRAEQALRNSLEKIPEQKAREAALAFLDELEDIRAHVAAAAGNPEKLDEGLTRLEEKFTEWTGESPTRGAGQTYAARTLLYEDCRRDTEVQVGRQVLGALQPGLSLLLQSARWLTNELANRYREAFRQAYERLTARSNSRVVDAVDFWVSCAPIFNDEENSIARSIIPAFIHMWTEILHLAPDQRRVTFTYEELRSKVESVFAAPKPGWSLARYTSPDVMIAASSPEAISRGEFELVLGEIHAGINSLMSTVFVAQHPSPDELCAAFAADFIKPRIVPVPRKASNRITARTNFEFVAPGDYRLLASADAGNASPDALVIASFVVEDCGGELVLRTRDNTVRFEIVEAISQILSFSSLHSFHISPELRHTPRITIDRLTICRESWRFLPAEIAFAHEEDEAKRFIRARSMTREYGLPRFIFVKTPVETKPFYVDFESPVLVNLFSKMVCNTLKTHPNVLITITEMLPEHGQFWLVDKEGSLYTGELRMVALDLAADQ